MIARNVAQGIWKKRQKMTQCKKCKGYWFPSIEKHYCEEFKVINKEDGEESIIFAHGEEDAVERWAKDYNENGDYCLMNETILVEVNGATYRVGAEASIEYTVDEIK